MANTVQQYKDYVITSFVKSVQPVVVKSAQGSIIRDVSGKEYLDCFAGISVVNAGTGQSQSHRGRQGPAKARTRK
ncbi:MAG TPA: hypothetical protein VF772_11265, partial [Terriglobales bacterium]